MKTKAKLKQSTVSIRASEKGITLVALIITMKRAIGEITYCQRVYDTHRDTKHWDASAEFSVDGNKYYGKVNVTSHKYVGQKIMILYNPKDPNDFISQSDANIGITVIIFGFVFLIPKFINKQKIKENL